MPRVQITFIIFVLMVFGCKESAKHDDVDTELLRVVTTISPYSDFAREIGGHYVSVETIIPSGANAHSYEPSPKELIEISKADIYFTVGAGFHFEKEFSFDGLQIIDCSKNIELLNNDPHVWLSPKNVEIIAGTIYEIIASSKPENRDYFKANYNRYIVELDSVFESIKKNLETFENRHIFVYHNSWNYLARDLELTVHDIEHGGKKPNLGDIDELIKSGRQNSARIIFADPNLSSKSAEIIANELNAKIEYINPLPNDYIKNLNDIGSKLSKALK